MKKYFKSVLILFGLCFSFLANAQFYPGNVKNLKRDVVVLVPGFFNSLAPSIPVAGESQNPWKDPYFSRSISAAIQAQGFDVYVVNNLKPVGGIAANGELLIQFLTSLQSKLRADQKMYLVCHSAGGLYSLYASGKTSLPITKIVTVSTPYSGLRFLDNVQGFASKIDYLLQWISLGNLLELNRKNVTEFMNKLKVPDDLSVQVYGGFQSPGLLWFDAKQLSSVLMITDALGGDSASDGIVTWDSAFAVKNFVSKSGRNIAPKLMKDYAHLEHWEQVVDHRLFFPLGVLNLDYIKREQDRFYAQLAQNLVIQ